MIVFDWDKLVAGLGTIVLVAGLGMFVGWVCEL